MVPLSRRPSGPLGMLDSGVGVVADGKASLPASVVEAECAVPVATVVGNAGAATLLMIVGSAGLAAATADLGMVGNAVPDEPAGSSDVRNGGGGNPPKKASGDPFARAFANSDCGGEASLPAFSASIDLSFAVTVSSAGAAVAVVTLLSTATAASSCRAAIAMSPKSLVVASM